MSRFLPLTVTGVRHETRDAVVVTLAPREVERAKFAFVQGQYLTFRKVLNGEEVRRSYSICSSPDDGVLKVGIKRVDTGTFSAWANEDLKAGDVIEALPPAGAFFTPLDAEHTRHFLAFAGGSGITPVLSLIKTTLAREPESHVTLVYANRSLNAIMFREELEDLKNVNLGRLSVLHVLESESLETNPWAGRIDAGKCNLLFKSWIEIKSVDMAFICGPEPMMLTIAASLRAHGLKDDQIKFELFGAPQPGVAKAVRKVSRPSETVCEASVTLDGATHTFTMPGHGQSLVDAALAHGIGVPYACKAGVCSTCRAKVLDGQVEMETNHALDDYEVKRGYVLTCQSYPISKRIAVSYDQ